MTQRGLTLLEVVLSVSLLSGLFLASGQWLKTVAVLGAQAEGPVRWERGARALLQSIHDDIWTGDTTLGDALEPVEVTTHSLLIRTRAGGDDGGPVTHEYEFLPTGSQIRRGDLPRSSPPLLEDVAALALELDAEARTLEVRVDSTAGHRVTRRFWLP